MEDNTQKQTEPPQGYSESEGDSRGQRPSGHPKIDENKQNGATTTGDDCSTCATFDPFVNFQSMNVPFA